MLFTGCKDGMIRIIIQECQYSVAFAFDACNFEVPTCIRLSNDGTVLVCGFESQKLVVYDTVMMSTPQEASWKFEQDKKLKVIQEINNSESDIDITREHQDTTEMDDVNKTAVSELPRTVNWVDWGAELQQDIKQSGTKIDIVTNEEVEVDFDHFELDFARNISGQGNNNANGKYTIRGKINIKEKTLKFKLVYSRDPDNVEWYQAKIVGHELIGIWGLNEEELSTSKLEFKMSTVLHDFSGYETFNDSKVNTEEKLIFQNGCIFSFGNDSEKGMYINRGSWSTTSNVVRWTKYFYESDSKICYVGSANKVRDSLVVKGHWLIDEETNHGLFELLSGELGMSNVERRRNSKILTSQGTINTMSIEKI